MEVGGRTLMWLTVKGREVHHGSKSQRWILGAVAGTGVAGYIVATARKQGLTH